ncbi:MAG TPA: DUF1549 and DUF1553 domain-containing protein, partial [Gemmataceae bacterium]|nr:DUF1549 and DUF1553 domain-containing protein [Gemmataceae bacterium]
MSFRCALFGLLAAAVAPAAEPKRAGPDWWSLRPVARPTPPAAADAPSGANPIDAFVRAKLTAAGLRPADPAEKLTLIRRVTFDLTGLPPTPAEIDAFLADDTAGAYGRVVDRLLASAHYGERWARHWLDVVRYSESHGFEYDRLRDHAWRYRDYVIRSLNEEKPCADFVREQIAGDVLKSATRDGVIATGMLVAGPNDQAGRISASAVVRGRAREDELEDMLGTVGQTFLGVTINCARCHDHKFDPFTARDYYRLKAVFDGVNPGDRPLYSPDELRARGGWLAGPLTSLRLSEMAYAANPKEPGPTRLLERGDVEKPGDAVTPGSATVIQGPPQLDLPADAPDGERRRRFAEWLVHPDNPLTWRVIVNRVWQHHFGEGLVRTPNDFGFNGERPTHPELLDWLAARFRDSGGQLKALHRLIVTSDTYRHSSAFDPLAAEVDADNRLLWRFAPRRLEAEVARDAMLAVSGRLNRAAGGPSARPFRVETFNSAFYIPF